MKCILFVVGVIVTTTVFGQNATGEVKPENLVPQLFQFKFQLFPTPMRVPEEDVLLTSKNWNKYGKKAWDVATNFEVKYKNKNEFYGQLEKDGDRFNTYGYLVYKGTMKFYNGDVFVGRFDKGIPYAGDYTFANGDKLTISPTGWQSPYRILQYQLANGDKLECNAEKNTIDYQYANGAIYKYHYGMSGEIYWQTKQGYVYKGILKERRPVGNWTVKDSLGTYFPFFDSTGLGGFIPSKKEDGSIGWALYKGNKLMRKVKQLYPGCFCMEGDCANGESTFFVGEDAEYGINAIFKGSFKNGNPIGDFTAQLSDQQGKRLYDIVGPIKDYKFNGTCTKAYVGKPISFTGMYSNGLPQKGNLTVDGKLIEVTGVEKGKYKGKQIFPRSDKLDYGRYYEGEFDEFGGINGKGSVYITDNNFWGYEGYKITADDWKNGYSGNCCLTKKDGSTDCERVYFVDRSNFPDYSFDHPVSQKSLADYQARQERERAEKDAASRKNQNEYLCKRCNGQGVIKMQCPMCKGAGYRKDLVTYDKYTGNTGGPATCSHCAGTGRYTVMGCSDCSGKGYVRK